MHGHLPHIQEFLPLAPYTTLGLGGAARYFAACRTDAELRDGIAHARERGLPLLILGGGSNLVIADEGFDGLVLKLETRGTSREDAPGGVRLTVAAGEAWDEFVRLSVEQGLSGVECLSGIPGSVGATPIQNVGAYGQEVSQTIAAVAATDIRTGESRSFLNAECRFGYRQSRFKLEDAGRYAVTGVTFMLQEDGRPQIRYPELQKNVASTVDLEALSPGAPALQAVRECVLALRRKKSMVLDPSDPNTKSAGSFFTNPVVSCEAADRLRARHAGLPSYPSGTGVKLPAAWLVEHAGFPKGDRYGGAAISENHSLALVNRGTTTAELLSLARRIQDAVQEQFGIRLEREPVVIGSTSA